MKIAVHPLTGNPTAAWQELSQQQKVFRITAKIPTSEAPSDKVKCQYNRHLFLLLYVS